MKKLAFVFSLLFVVGLGQMVIASPGNLPQNEKSAIASFENDKKPHPADCTCAECTAKKAEAKTAEAKTATDAKACPGECKAKADEKKCCTKAATDDKSKAETPKSDKK